MPHRRREGIRLGPGNTLTAGGNLISHADYVEVRAVAALNQNADGLMSL